MRLQSRIAISRATNLCIIAMDGNDLDEIEARPSAIVDVFDREARHAMDLKRIEIEENQ